MATEIGKLVAVFEADTSNFDAAARRIEKSSDAAASALQSSLSRIKAGSSTFGAEMERSAGRIAQLRDRIKEIRADDIDFKPARIRMYNGLLADAITHHRGLKTAAKESAAAIKAGAHDAHEALRNLSPGLAGITSVAGPLSAVAIGLVAVGGASAGILALARYSAQLGSEIHDLSQKINFSAETLSSLKVAAELSGGSLASLSTSLGIFDKNLEEAKDSTSEQSKLFKALNIDLNDNEKALQQAFTALTRVEDGAQQTALAMKLFGRSGKEVLGIIKETDGDIGAFTQRMRELGLVITSDGAKKADQFGDQLTLLQAKIESLGREIGAELVPTVSKAADDISRWMKENQGEIKRTSQEIGTLIGWAYQLAKVVAELSPIVLTVRIVRQFSDLTSGPKDQYSGGPESGTLDLGSMNAPAGIPADMPRLSVFRQKTEPHFKFTTYEDIVRKQQQEALDKLNQKAKGGRGGGGGGGGKLAKDELEGLKGALVDVREEFRRYDAELFNSANHTALVSEKSEILRTLMSGLKTDTQLAVSQIKNVDEAIDTAIGSLPQKSQAAARALVDQRLAQFKVNEETRIAAELTRTTEELAKQWTREARNAASGADEYAIAIEDLSEEYRKYGLELQGATKAELESMAAQARHLKVLKAIEESIQRAREGIADIFNRQPGLELPGVNVPIKGDWEPQHPIIDILGEPPSDRILQDLVKAREYMRVLAQDLTSVFSQSIRAGIEQGASQGLATFAQGLLAIVEDIFLRRLAAGLEEILFGIGTRGSGGGLLGGIFGAILGGIGGGVGGKVSAGAGFATAFAGGFADGGYLPPGRWGIAGERGPEPIFGGSTGMTVVPNRGGAVTNNYYTINLPPSPRGSYTPKRSAREQADMLIAGIQGANR